MDLFLSQLIDPFRIGLLFFLLHTALRTRHATGMAMPLLLGVVFVAILIPLTTSRVDAQTTLLWQAIATGVAANAVILSVFVAAWFAWRKSR